MLHGVRFCFAKAGLRPAPPPFSKKIIFFKKPIDKCYTTWYIVYIGYTHSQQYAYPFHKNHDFGKVDCNSLTAKEIKMNIIITNTGGVPIYEQIAGQIKGLILSGSLKEGEPLPSMRNLAQDLRISVITTKRAYEILESEGLIESYTGKGSFVSAQNPELLREQNLREIEMNLQKAVDIARRSGVELSEMTEILGMLYN